MLFFEYTAKDPKTNSKVKAVVQADSEQSAAKLIKSQGLVPIDIKVQKLGGFGLGKITNRVRSKDKVLFSRQLSTLINAGLPIVQSLRSVGSQTTNKRLKIVTGQIVADVEAGQPLSKAIAKYPDIFSEIFISLVAAGEVSGTLDKALERIANQQEKDAEILSKVRGAMVYPAVVVFVMIGVVGFMIVKVLPQVEDIYVGIPGASLPFLTTALLAVSHFVTKFWWLLLILFALSGVFTSRWARTLGGKRVIDRLKMRSWLIGPLFMKLYMARFARTAATLVASGVPLLQVIEVTGRAINNIHIEDSLKHASEKVRGGKALSEALAGDKNFLELVPNMLKIGEQSGAIEQMLEKIADYYEKEVDSEIKTISTIIEPVLMIILGVVAFIIVAAILLPIYGLADKAVIN